MDGRSEKHYELIIWHGERGAKTKVGIFSESFCRAYCKKFAGKGDLHIQCNEVPRDFVL